MRLAEAAVATNRSTLFRAYKSGRMSATRADTRQIEVDPAELFRVFPPGLRRSRAHRAKRTSAHRLAMRTRRVETRCVNYINQDVTQNVGDDAREPRRMAGGGGQGYGCPACAAPIAEKRRGWWRRLVG
jgi:hypothetical protein